MFWTLCENRSIQLSAGKDSQTTEACNKTSLSNGKTKQYFYYRKLRNQRVELSRNISIFTGANNKSHHVRFYLFVLIRFTLQQKFSMKHCRCFWILYPLPLLQFSQCVYFICYGSFLHFIVFFFNCLLSNWLIVFLFSSKCASSEIHWNVLTAKWASCFHNNFVASVIFRMLHLEIVLEIPGLSYCYLCYISGTALVV